MEEGKKRGRPFKDPDAPKTINFKTDTTENIHKTLSKLVNMAANDKMPLNAIRMMNELIKSIISLKKVIELEQEIKEIKEILGINEEEI